MTKTPNKKEAGAAAAARIKSGTSLNTGEINAVLRHLIKRIEAMEEAVK